MSGIAIFIWIVVILLLVGGGIGLLIYGLHKHEDKQEKTTTHKIMAIVGGALIGIGVILLMFFLLKYKRENKNASVIQPKIQDDMGQIEMMNQRDTLYQTQMMNQREINNQNQMMNQNQMNQGGMYAAQGPIMFQNPGLYQVKTPQFWEGQDVSRWNSGPSNWNAPGF